MNTGGSIYPERQRPRATQPRPGSDGVPVKSHPHPFPEAMETQGAWRLGTMKRFVYLGPEESWLPSQRLEAPPCQRPSFSQAPLEFSLGQKPEARWGRSPVSSNDRYHGHSHLQGLAAGCDAIPLGSWPGSLRVWPSHSWPGDTSEMAQGGRDFRGS